MQDAYHSLRAFHAQIHQKGFGGSGFDPHTHTSMYPYPEAFDTLAGSLLKFSRLKKMRKFVATNKECNATPLGTALRRSLDKCWRTSLALKANDMARRFLTYDALQISSCYVGQEPRAYVLKL